MKSGKFWIAVIVASVIANVIDYVGQGIVLTGRYYSKLTHVFRQDVNTGWLVFGDFVAVLVLAWVYDKVAPVADSISGCWSISRPTISLISCSRAIPTP